MTPEAQRIALAEWDGFRWYRMPKHPSDSRRYRTLFLPLVHEYEGQSPEWLEKADGSESCANWEYMRKEGYVPDYLNDLNVVRTLEVRLSPAEFAEYKHELMTVIIGAEVPNPAWLQSGLPSSSLAICATAPQRCEAILKTLNLWKE